MNSLVFDSFTSDYATNNRDIDYSFIFNNDWSDYGGLSNTEEISMWRLTNMYNSVAGGSGYSYYSDLGDLIDDGINLFGGHYDEGQQYIVDQFVKLYELIHNWKEMLICY